MRALLGGVLGAALGGVAGVLLGLAFVELAQVSDFEGRSGYLVGFLFMPAGIVVGAVAGAILLRRRGGRQPPEGGSVRR